MKFQPLKNQPNVSQSRLESISPSLKMDDRNFPHVVWLDKKSGGNEVRYSFWNGLKWDYNGDTSFVYNSKESITSFQHSLLLDSDNYASIVFANESALGSRLYLAQYLDGWDFTSLNVNYTVSWMGCVFWDKEFDHSSSSSSSLSSLSGSSDSSSSSLDSSSSSSSSNSISSESSDSSESSSSVSSFSSSSMDSSSSSSLESSSLSSLSLSSLSSSSKSTSSSSSSSSVDSSSSTSSSSSSSTGDANKFVVVYDSENAQFNIYAVTTQWVLLGQISALVSDYSSIKIDICGRNIGIVYTDLTVLYYNFFDLYLETWLDNTGFIVLNSSINGENITGVDVAGYHDEDEEGLSIGWLAYDTSFSVRSALLMTDGTETPSDGVTNLVESDSNPMISDNDSTVNGYKKISVSLNEYYLPQLLLTGLQNKCYRMLGSVNTWVSYAVDFDFVVDGACVKSLKSSYTDQICSVFSLDSGDIYYGESDSTSAFTTSTPDISLLNDFYVYRGDYVNGEMDGSNILGTHNSYCGSILRESKAPAVVSVERNTYPSETVKTIDLNSASVISGRNFSISYSVNSLDVDQVNGKILVTKTNDDNGLVRGRVILYPQSQQVEINEPVVITSLAGSDLSFPMDAKFDYARRKIWIADTGNNRIMRIDEENRKLEFYIGNMVYPCSIAPNVNNGGAYIRCFSDVHMTVGRVSFVSYYGETLYYFEFDNGAIDESSSTSSETASGSSDSMGTSSSSSSHDTIPQMPSYRSIAYDHVRSRVWWVSGATVYMYDERNNQIKTLTILSSEYGNAINLDIEHETGNAFIVTGNGVDESYIIQIAKDNSVMLASCYVRD